MLFAFPALLAGAQALGLGGALSLLKARITGPLAGAIGVGVLALGLVIGIAWLISDAKSDVREACAAEALKLQLSQASARERAMRAALAVRDAESSRLRHQAAAAEDEIKLLGIELEQAREKSRLTTGNRAAVPWDDPWLRQGRAPASARDR